MVSYQKKEKIRQGGVSGEEREKRREEEEMSVKRKMRIENKEICMVEI